MFGKGVVSVLLVLFSLNLHARGCGGDNDCNKWSETNCACGVSARCNGLTAQNTTGTCQCFGAAGNCNKATDDDAAVYAVPAGRVPVRRGAAPVRRGAARGYVDVDVSKSR
ncbi:MAG: hypothetical protein P1U32_03860 [Legionellaceae bacterium]|nr:hypothetical protein [Legionellaceae bacterium]